jgi:tetratricopeptide (TPR) repeat protein
MGSAGSILFADIDSLSCTDVERLLQTDEEHSKYAPLVRRHRIDGKRLHMYRTQEQLKTFLQDISITNEVEVDSLASFLFQFVARAHKKSSSKSFVDNADQLPQIGLTMTSIDGFIAEVCGGMGAIQNLTCEEVVAKYIKPFAEKNDAPTLSYCEIQCRPRASKALISAENTEATAFSMEGFGDANVFVSHARGELFAGFVSTLREHFQLYHKDEAGSVLMWIDMFSQPQTGTGAHPSHIAVKSVIARIDNTMFISSTWRHCTALQRTWCLWELHCSLSRADSCVLTLVMPSRERSDLLNAFMSSNKSVLSDLCVVDVDSSLVSDVEDKHSIMASLTEVDGVNKSIQNFMRSWFVNYIHAEVNSDSSRQDAVRRTMLQCALAHVYQASGQYETAEALFSQSVNEFTSLLGTADATTLQAMYDCAMCCKDAGKMHESFELFNECLKHRSSTLGNAHVDTLQTLNALSVAYLSQNMFTEAEPVCKMCYKTLRAACGAQMRETLVAMNNYGQVLKACGRFEEAEEILKECWQLRVQSLGEDHIETLSTLPLLASVLIKLNEQKEAKAMLSLCLLKFTDLCGAEHPRTQQCKSLMDKLESRKPLQNPNFSKLLIKRTDSGHSSKSTEPVSRSNSGISRANSRREM